jgi:hypothetical protein
LRLQGEAAMAPLPPAPPTPLISRFGKPDWQIIIQKIIISIDEYTFTTIRVKHIFILG